MRTRARVKSVDGMFAMVEVTRLSACEGCHKAEEGGCSVCSLMGGSVKTAVTRAKNSASASVGDLVEVESSSGRMLSYAALLFLLPLAFAALGYALASAFTEEAGLRAVGAAVGLVLAFLGAILYSRIIAKKRCDVEIVEIIKKNNQNE